AQLSECKRFCEQTAPERDSVVMQTQKRPRRLIHLEKPVQERETNCQQRNGQRARRNGQVRQKFARLKEIQRKPKGINPSQKWVYDAAPKTYPEIMRSRAPWAPRAFEYHAVQDLGSRNRLRSLTRPARRIVARIADPWPHPRV